MNKKPESCLRDWAHFRFSVIGGLLAVPPKKGELRKDILRLSERQYRHPIKGTPITVGASTIERWYYKARDSNDPVRALTRKLRSDSGSYRVLSDKFLKELKKQYNAYPQWSYRLHSDNLKARMETDSAFRSEPAPSYATVRRRMIEKGWFKKRSAGRNLTDGKKLAMEKLEKREVRSFESEYSNALWHLDFHEGSRSVDIDGNWYTPKALCILDDHSRLCCHIQWYTGETASALFHGLMQAFLKRGLPRALMTDNGSAMEAEETFNGLAELGVKHEKTLPYSPYQNGKQEKFWGQLEGRLLAMLSRVKQLDLAFLNKATHAWIEQEYNLKYHEEIHTSPIKRLINGKDVSRPAPSFDDLRFAFTAHTTRTQRKNDGTISLKGIRFEVPSRFRHIRKLTVHYQSWDLSKAWIVNEKTRESLARIFPEDKTRNANGRRRALDQVDTIELSPDDELEEIPSLMSKYLADYSANGLPPAYLPREESGQFIPKNSEENQNEQ